MISLFAFSTFAPQTDRHSRVLFLALAFAFARARRSLARSLARLSSSANSAARSRARAPSSSIDVLCRNASIVSRAKVLASIEGLEVMLARSHHRHHHSIGELRKS